MVVIILAEKKVKEDMCILGQPLHQHTLYEERGYNVTNQMGESVDWEGRRREREHELSGRRGK